MFIVKLPADLLTSKTLDIALGAVLQVTPNLVPSEELSVAKISLLAVTAVVLTTQVCPEAATAQENAPAAAAPQATTEGFPTPTAMRKWGSPSAILVAKSI
jgi:hypothetical protein